MVMKRIYNYIKNLIVTRYKLMCFITFLLFLSSIISVLCHHIPLTAGLHFGGSLVSSVRLWTYDAGKIPFIRDSTFDAAVRRNKRKNINVTPEELYKQISLRMASIHFIVAVLGFVLWIIVELLALFLSLM